MADELRLHAPRRHLFAGQLQHLLLLAGLLPGAFCLAEPALGDGSALGIADRTWLLAALAVPIVHQGLVALVWRSQLGFRALTRLFGERDLSVWRVLFLPLLVARPLSLAALAAADPGSLGWPRPLVTGLGVLLLVPCAYTLHSVRRHFGTARAVGGDHFRESYRRMPLVRAGAFRWSSNAMYAYAFLGLWAIALLADSRAALAAALFQHAYVWVHWYCTEKPDLELLYGAA